MSEIETKPLDYDVWAASRQAIRNEQKAQPGSLPDCLHIAAWLIAVSAILAGFILWPRGYDASEAQMVVAISYAATGLITAPLVAAVGRIIQLLEAIVAKKA
jgi:hypothetical protein